MIDAMYGRRDIFSAIYAAKMSVAMAKAVCRDEKKLIEDEKWLEELRTYSPPSIAVLPDAWP
jgi:hypothetical protein